MRIVTAIAVFLLALAAGVLVLEVYVQGAEIFCPFEFALDPRLGPQYVPGVEFSRFSEGFFLGGANRWGFLGPGAPPRRRGDELRIVLLGDSFALGHTVFARHHFARGIEREVAAATGRPARVLNFAHADYALTNMHQLYRDKAAAWDHDLVIYMVERSDLAPRMEADPSFYPTCTVEGDSLRYRYDMPRTEKYRTFKRLEPLLLRLASPRLVFEFLKVLDRGDGWSLVLGKFGPPRREVVLPDPDGPPSWPMWETSRRILRRLADDPRALVVLSGPVYPAYRRDIADAGVDPFDLNPVFDAMEAAGIDPTWWPVTGRHGHWNHAAHRAIGQALGREAARRLAARDASR